MTTLEVLEGARKELLSLVEERNILKAKQDTSDKCFAFLTYTGPSGVCHFGVSIIHELDKEIEAEKTAMKFKSE